MGGFRTVGVTGRASRHEGFRPALFGAQRPLKPAQEFRFPPGAERPVESNPDGRLRTPGPKPLPDSDFGSVSPGAREED
jgi:hypothetical protein